MFKVDLTQKGNSLHERLLGKYRVKGVPTVVFLDKEGRERPELRLLYYAPPEQFLARLAVLTKK
jgi:thiol:disulfide interchange protein DsbD